MVNPKRGEIYLVRLDPTEGSEIKKTRPALIVSPDELNAHLKTVIAAPLTSSPKSNPFRIAVSFAANLCTQVGGHSTSPFKGEAGRGMGLNWRT